MFQQIENQFSKLVSTNCFFIDSYFCHVFSICKMEIKKSKIYGKVGVLILLYIQILNSFLKFTRL